MGLVDIGANLANGQYRDDVAEVINRAREAGVHKLISIGTDLASSEASVALATQYSGQVYATAGVHPHDADAADSEALEAIRQLAAQPAVCAIGEMGLDFNRNYSTPDNQLRVFEAQLAMASDIAKPVYLHERDAFKQQIERLRAFRPQLAGGVAHCFTGDTSQLKAYLELDLYIGITGWVCDPKRGKDLREALAYIPPERILLETDAPFLMPRGYKQAQLGISQKRRNEPCALPHIADFVAQQLGKTLEEITLASTHNALLLFNLDG